MATTDEAALTARDERIAAQLSGIIKTNEEEIRALRGQIAWLEGQNDRIEDAARKEKWWRLEGTLAAADVESLCNVSPVDLLAESGRKS